MNAIQQLLTSELVASLLNIHPNDVGKELDFEPPPSWSTWWDWAGEGEGDDDSPCRWLRLSDCFNSESSHDTHNVPREICELIRDIQRLQIPRQPVDMNDHSSQRIILDDRGMSPKKIHEVSRMAAYLEKLLNNLSIDPKRVRIVDVGAGQGYLTRTLKLYLQTSYVLALDSDQWQTRGSQVWEARVARALRAAGHNTTLISVVDDWVRETTEEPNDGDPDPVLFIALHACGSLTPDILRACVNASRRRNTGWKMAGAVVVGCCYNLLKSTDFPLSKVLSTSSPALNLPPSAFNLATQIPSQWLMSPNAVASVSSSVRKVVWRALLGRELLYVSAFGKATKDMLEPRSDYEGTIPIPQPRNHSAPPSRQRDGFEPPPPGAGTRGEIGLGIGTSSTMRLLGRLPDSAYTTWSTFLHAAGQKLGVDLSASTARGRDLSLERRLEVLHVLRCLVGPLVESLIILDRVYWLREEMAISESEDAVAPANVGLRELRLCCIPEKQGSGTCIETVNLFDQATGSGRNVAIVVVPAYSTSTPIS